jgi:hypothetical protein
VKTSLYNHYLVFAQPSLSDLFSDKNLQALTLRFAQLHLSCVEKCEQNGFILADRFDPSTLPDLGTFFNQTLQTLNASFGNLDVLHDPNVFPLLSQFFTMVALEFQFIEQFCLFLRLPIQDFTNVVQRIIKQANALTQPDIDLESRSLVIYELIQTILFIGVPFIMGYESYAWIPRALADILQFEKTMVDEYLSQINNSISPTETMPLGTWFNQNQTAMVQNPPYNETLPIIDVIFTQALTAASDLYNYSQLSQYAQFLQARFEVEAGTAVIIIGKFYNPEINRWILENNFGSRSTLMSIAHTPINLLIGSSSQDHAPPLGSESPPSHSDEFPADLIFAETAGDFSTPPKLAEIERVLNILKGKIE